jgi:hypothetical protein
LILFANFTGFTYTIHVVKDNQYGNDIYGNGTWNGMIGEIIRGVFLVLAEKFLFC